MNSFDAQCSISKQIKFPQSVVGYLNYQEVLESSKQNYPTCGGITSDSQYMWFANGPRFQVTSTLTGSKLAAWCFGDVLRDKHTCVTCAVELPGDCGRTPLFAVGLECQLTGGMICIFDIVGSKVIRAIQIDDKVTSLYVISPGGCGNELVAVPGSLQALDGVLAVGTWGGSLLLLDLCREVWQECTMPVRDELDACQLQIHRCVDFSLGTVEMLKANTVQTDDHLALQLDDNNPKDEIFTLWAPDGECSIRGKRSKIEVSTLCYVPQLIGLLVGYNFGAWQLYNLLTAELEYTSPIYEECVPVSHFAFQEPSDDPRAFCYVWTIYSQRTISTQRSEPSCPLAAMYALVYDSKETLQGCGMLYQKFLSCSLRFQMDLVILSGISDANYGKCFALNAYAGPTTSNIEGSSEQRLALCSMAWSVWSKDDPNPESMLCVIDLDQWYKEQMPSEVKTDKCDSYIAKFNLTRILEDDNTLLDLRIKEESLSVFTAVQRLEEHYYPSALAFDFVCANTTNMFCIANLGLQRYLLHRLEIGGADDFLRPGELAQCCTVVGLGPLTTDNPDGSPSSPRDLLLSVALEHGLLSLLTRCATQWATGSHASEGCTLGGLVEWAIHRADVLRKKAGEICVPLFDFSDVALDCNARRLLDQCSLQLHHLTVVFNTIIKRCSSYLNENATTEIMDQKEALQMMATYLEVLQWLLNVGLLPEAPQSTFAQSLNFTSSIRAPYPIDSLTLFYENRRKELNGICNIPEMKAERTSCNLLFIDNLIEHECGGDLLRKQWALADTEDVNSSGLYPPRTLQSLLRTYLIPGIDIKYKHTILVYVFLDLAMSLDQSRYSSIVTHLIKFPAVFRLSPAIIKITQAFWQLDHGDFETAMEQLLDPLVGGGGNGDKLQPWQHRTVLRSLLAHKQYRHALLYLQVRQPPLTDTQDICTAMDLLLANGMLHDAFQFQRQHRNNDNAEELITHFIKVCFETNSKASIFQLSLQPEEENILMKLLRKGEISETDSLRMMFYLQRGRFVEAIQLENRNEEVDINTKRHGLFGMSEMNLHSAVLQGYKSVLPNVMKSLLEKCKQDKSLLNWRQVPRPTPMTVNVQEKIQEARYKSSLIAKSLVKARETWGYADAFDFDPSEDNRRHSPPPVEGVEATPFLCTPKTNRASLKRSTPIVYPNITYQSNYVKRSYSISRADDVSPAKRMKFDGNRSVAERSATEQLLLTPVVKRKSPSFPKHSFSEKYPVPSLQSILKVRHLVRDSQSPDSRSRGNTVTPELNQCEDSQGSDDLVFEKKSLNESSTSSNTRQNTPKVLGRPSLLGATPRKSLLHTPRPMVHFEDLINAANGSISEDSQNLEPDRENSKKTLTEMPPKVLQINVELSGSAPSSAEDVFYSASDGNGSYECQETNSPKLLGPLPRQSLKRTYTPPDKNVPVTADLSSPSVRTRSSRKVDDLKSPQIQNSPQVRNSPRATKKNIIAEESPKRTRNVEAKSLEISTRSPDTPKLSRSSLRRTSESEKKVESPLKRIRGRKPLARHVLESNLIRNISCSALDASDSHSVENDSFQARSPRSYNLRSSSSFSEIITREKSTVENSGITTKHEMTVIESKTSTCDVEIDQEEIEMYQKSSTPRKCKSSSETTQSELTNPSDDNDKVIESLMKTQNNIENEVEINPNKSGDDIETDFPEENRQLKELDFTVSFNKPQLLDSSDVDSSFYMKYMRHTPDIQVTEEVVASIEDNENADASDTKIENTEIKTTDVELNPHVTIPMRDLSTKETNVSIFSESRLLTDDSDVDESFYQKHIKHVMPWGETVIEEIVDYEPTGKDVTSAENNSNLSENQLPVQVENQIHEIGVEIVELESIPMGEYEKPDDDQTSVKSEQGFETVSLAGSERSIPRSVRKDINVLIEDVTELLDADDGEDVSAEMNAKIEEKSEDNSEKLLNEPSEKTTDGDNEKKESEEGVEVQVICLENDSSVSASSESRQSSNNEESYGSSDSNPNVCSVFERNIAYEQFEEQMDVDEEEELDEISEFAKAEEIAEAANQPEYAADKFVDVGELEDNQAVKILENLNQIVNEEVVHSSENCAEGNDRLESEKNSENENSYEDDSDVEQSNSEESVQSISSENVEANSDNTDNSEAKHFPEVLEISDDEDEDQKIPEQEKTYLTTNTDIKEEIKESDSEINNSKVNNTQNEISKETELEKGSADLLSFENAEKCSELKIGNLKHELPDNTKTEQTDAENFSSQKLDDKSKTEIFESPIFESKNNETAGMDNIMQKTVHFANNDNERVETNNPYNVGEVTMKTEDFLEKNLDIDNPTLYNSDILEKSDILNLITDDESDRSFQVENKTIAEPLKNTAEHLEMIVDPNDGVTDVDKKAKEQTDDEKKSEECDLIMADQRTRRRTRSVSSRVSVSSETAVIKPTTEKLEDMDAGPSQEIKTKPKVQRKAHSVHGVDLVKRNNKRQRKGSKSLVSEIESPSEIGIKNAEKVKTATPSKRTSHRKSTLPKVDEEETEIDKLKSLDEEKKDRIEEYTTSRRMTRRQKSLLARSMEITESRYRNSKRDDYSESAHESDVSEDDRGPKIENLDPIILLEKETFEGQPDPEEHNILKSSPSSSVKTTSSAGTSVSRKVSKIQKQSPSDSENSTTHKFNLRKRNQGDDASVNSSKLRRSSSRQSLTLDVTTPPRRSRRLSTQTPTSDKSASDSVSVTSVASKISNSSSVNRRILDFGPDVRRSPRNFRFSSPVALSHDAQDISSSDVPEFEFSPPKTNLNTGIIPRKSMLPINTDLSCIAEEGSSDNLKTSTRESSEENQPSPPKRGRKTRSVASSESTQSTMSLPAKSKITDEEKEDTASTNRRRVSLRRSVSVEPAGPTQDTVRTRKVFRLSSIRSKK